MTQQRPLFLLSMGSSPSFRLPLCIITEKKRWQKPHQCSLNMEKRKENEEQWVYHYPHPTASNTIISVCTVGIPTWDLLCTSKLSPKCTCCRTLSVWWALLSSSLPLGNLKSPTLKVKSIPKDCIFMGKKISFHFNCKPCRPVFHFYRDTYVSLHRD